jgi:Beta protein
MFTHRHYVPVLKGKRAEFPALGDLRSKADITPLIEAVPSAWGEVPRRMAESARWPEESPYFLDLFFVDDPDDTEEADESHPVRRCFAEVAERGQFAIPVTGLARSPGYQSAIRRVVSEQGRGLAMRLSADDFEDSENFEEAIGAIAEFFGQELGEIDLFLDHRSVAGFSGSGVAQMCRANIDLIPNLGRWRTLTVASSAFPLGLGPLERDQWNPVIRADWRGWHRLVAGPRPPARLPAFGDYAIAHPELPPEGRATILAQLRYATPDCWLVWKGENVFRHPDGYAQFLAICRDLVERDEYRGPDFSRGDAEIFEKATSAGSCGNAESWRRIGTNHHIETVLEQIASLP